jgi:hypothetical protein
MNLSQIAGQETEGKALLTQSKKDFMRKLQLEVRGGGREGGRGEERRGEGGGGWREELEEGEGGEIAIDQLVMNLSQIAGQETEGKALFTQSKKDFMRKLQLEV